MGTVGIVLIVVAVIIIAIVWWYISTMNRLRKIDVKCDEALSGIDVALTKRYDTLTKMLEVTKGYAKHEYETLKDIIAMRQPGANASVEDKAAYANQITSALKSLNVVVEKYPELKADTQFSKLNDHIAQIEDNLQASRRLYNSNVTKMNQAIVVFPTSIVANRIGISKRSFFEAEEMKRQDVEMKF